jgi:hypothetical protein
MVQGRLWGPRRSVSAGVGARRRLKTYCGSGGRWFESTQLYQQDQELRSRGKQPSEFDSSYGKQSVSGYSNFKPLSVVWYT